MKRILSVILALMITILFSSCTPKQITEPSSSVGMTVWFLNVGQGDCTLLESGGEYMLVDAGERDYSEQIVNFLRERGVERLSYVVATHPHSDHIGGMKTIINTFGTDTFITRETDSDTFTWTKLLKAVRDKGCCYLDAKVGSSYALGDARFTILAPLKDGYEGYNNYSVVLMVQCGEARFLLTGDAERESEIEMLEAGEELNADVLKCGHHGSSDASGAAFLQAVNPACAVISCGQDNEYGHPHRETIERLSLLGAEVLRTDTMSTISASTDGRTITFHTEGGSYEASFTAGKKKTTPAALDLIGNLKSRYFHDPTCKGAKDIKEKNRTTFSSRSEALEQGYEPCPNCKP